LKRARKIAIDRDTSFNGLVRGMSFLSDNVFLDTNVLVCANDTAEPKKQRTARTLIKDVLHAGNGVISVQFLREFRVTVTRKIHKPLSVSMARQEAELFGLMTVVDLDSILFFDALRVQQLYQISYWDAQIVVAAESAGCTTLYSEDLNAGQEYAKVMTFHMRLLCRRYSRCMDAGRAVPANGASSCP
jgi:predicted nucleic acid-binding protein